MVHWAYFSKRSAMFFLTAVYVLGFLLTTSSLFAKEEKLKPVTDIHFQEVIDKARQLSALEFQAPHKNIPQALKEIGYDQWRDIRFKPSKSLWAKEPFSVQFFHLGFLYQDPVIVHELDKKGAQRVPFSPDLFDHAKGSETNVLTEDVGFAGFRVHYPLNTPKYADELVSFLGASYFRALGKDLSYGMSARGLAVNTAEDTGEEFPLFREFWIARPHRGAKEITIYALLDSESVTGAYIFVVRPGVETLMNVKSVLFIRKNVHKLGIAPLTSMFFYGEHSGFKGNNDFRPEVHDSDGLLIQAASGEWVWHPLVNPLRMLINSFSGDQPRGFGLLQRDMDFDHYQDLEARYERRPGVWVVPQGDWGKGYVELIQLPTESEYNDNIVAFWVPEKSFSAGDVLTYSYSLSWHGAKVKRHALGIADATRIVRKHDEVMFLIDFSGDALRTLAPGKGLSVDAWVSRGYTITGHQIIKNPVTGGYRLVLHTRTDKAGLLPDLPLPMELRVFLKDKDRPVTETWSYTYQP